MRKTCTSADIICSLVPSVRMCERGKRAAATKLVTKAPAAAVGRAQPSGFARHGGLATGRIWFRRRSSANTRVEFDSAVPQRGAAARCCRRNGRAVFSAGVAGESSSAPERAVRYLQRTHRAPPLAQKTYAPRIRKFSRCALHQPGKNRHVKGRDSAPPTPADWVVPSARSQQRVSICGGR